MEENVSPVHSAALAVPRPMLTRQESDSLFDSYYESALADQPALATPHPADKAVSRPVTVQSHRTPSVDSDSSSSDYSTDSSFSEYSSKDASPPAFRQRLCSGSDGAADRRRIAVVQMDSVPSPVPTAADPEKSPVSPSESVRARRGLDDSLRSIIFVSPPDRQHRQTASLDPPSTAPATQMPKEYSDLDANSHSRSKSHQRSASDAVGTKPSSRKVAIVGTSLNPLILEPLTETSPTVRPPLFIRPQSRSPSPGSAVLSAPSPDEQFADTLFMFQGTPSTSTANHRSDASSSISPSDAASHTSRSRKAGTVSSDIAARPFLNYQPGIDATAGPLPEPPRPSFFVSPNTPPPRPPRLHSPPPVSRSIDARTVKQAQQSLPSFSAKVTPSKDASHSSTLDAKEPIPVPSASDRSRSSSPEKSSSLNTTSHIREGAFSPSQMSDTRSSSSDVGLGPSVSKMSQHERLPGTHESCLEPPGFAIEIESPTTPAPLSAVVPPQEDAWVSINRDLTSSPEGRTSGELSVSSHSHHSDQSAPSPPPKSPKNIRRSFTSGFKRMSLHRSPSHKSLSRSSSIGHGSNQSHRSGGSSQPRSQSPPEMPPLPAMKTLPPRKKIKTLYPAAMYCHEINSQRTAQERILIYIQKINDLYVCDCGLSDWVLESKDRNATKVNSSLSGAQMGPSIPSIQQFSPQPRVTSHSSMMSETTFPRRPDATKATDLTGHSDDSNQTSSPLVLPYPALASSPQPPKVKLTGSGSIAASSQTTPAKSSFFASLGRKASLNKGNKVLATNNNGSPARLTKNPPPNIMAARIPGGPRAPGNRVAKSQTLILSPTASSSDYSSSLSRSPSVNPSPSPERSQMHNPEFTRQVDKLAELLPHADRQILSGYLRRSGEAMLAIGQYLEDEKNGTLKPQ